MRLRIIFRLAFKNLWSHRLRSFITIIGVTIGIGSIIFLVSLGYGLEQLVTSQVANFNAFTVIDIPAASVSAQKIDDNILSKISALGHVKTAAPVSNIAGRIRRQESASTAETVIMAAKTDYWKMADIAISKGKLPSNASEVALNQSVISLIGEDASSVIGKQIDLDLIIPEDLRSQSGSGIKLVENVKLTVAGVLSDNKTPVALVDLSLLQANDATKYSSLKIKTDSSDSVPALRKQLENMGFQTDYVGDTVTQISQVFSLFRAILALFGLVALVVAALGTFNTLTISLLERIREVGLFKALGMRNKDIYKLFLAESLIIGMFGGFLGLGIGTGLGKILNLILSFLAERSGAEAITVFITPWAFSAGIAVFSVIVGFLTGWYPAKRAVKIDPLDALRYE